MDLLEVIHILAHIFLGTIAVVALIKAMSIQRRAPGALRRDLDDVVIQLIDHEQRLASLLKSHKRLNSRVAMRQARAEQSEHNAEQLAGGTFKQLPGESESDWKARCRRAIAAGEIKHAN